MTGTDEDIRYRFDPGAVPIDGVARRAADMWADLRFDRDAQARIRRDGLVLDGINLGGPSPYRFDVQADAMVVLTIESDQSTDILLDLWRLHFERGLRARPAAA